MFREELEKVFLRLTSIVILVFISIRGGVNGRNYFIWCSCAFFEVKS
jgi:hypothetical protein